MLDEILEEEMRPLRYVVTGTGRCGTQFMARLFTGIGILCGHEAMFNTWGCNHVERFAESHPELMAAASWLAAPCLGQKYLEGTQVIHLVRHPRKVINSLRRMEFWNFEGYSGFALFARNHLPGLDDWSDPVNKSAHFYLAWNDLIEGKADYFHRVEDAPQVLLDEMRLTYNPRTLFSDTRANAYGGDRVDDTALDEIDLSLRGQLVERTERYGYESWGEEPPVFAIEVQPLPQPASLPVENPVIKAIITTLDNLPMLQEQISILSEESEISEIIVVNNGSVDGTKEWLGATSGVTAVHRENKGAGPGRNSGLDAAGEFDYVLLVDGGIRPLRNSVGYMLDYLQRHPGVDVISPEVMTCFSTDIVAAHRRMVAPIDEKTCFPQRMLSSTAYALCRKRAWDGIRFSEEGPFGEAGWGADDNEMAFRWNKAGIVHHDFAGVQLYRRAGGSHARLFKETGIWPNQYGSVYEQRVVKMYQDYPHQANRWQGKLLEVSAVVLGWNEYPMFARAIKAIHEDLKDIPHEVIFVDNASTDETKWWLDTFALRQAHGDTAIDARTGQILRRTPELEPIWTGDVVRIDLAENTGAGTGSNVGFEKAVGKYIFYLDGDILPTLGSVKALKEYLDGNPGVSFACLNPWVSQKETEEVEFNGLGNPLGLGNYGYSYCMMRREIIDAGCRMADQGPFAGPGCGYQDAEFASQMYAKDFRCVVFNKPKYYHDIRNTRRAGFEQDASESLVERKQWLKTRWREDGLFDITYHNMPVERHVRRVAVIGKPLENQLTPAGHLAAALSGICAVERFNPGDEPEGWDDYFYVDDGPSSYMEPAPHGHPAHFWAIDMIVPHQSWRQSPEGYLERAKAFDRTYAAQPDSVAYLRQHDIDAKQLYLAANPDYHKPHNEEKIYDWIALWHNCGDRIAYAEGAMEAFPEGHVGWRGGKGYAQWMCKARCSLNLSRSNELNMRIFETMATGVPLLTDHVRGIDKLFMEGEHYRGFSTIAEMLEQIQWVLDHPGDAQEMAQRARELVLAKHTYYHRVLQVWGS